MQNYYLYEQLNRSYGIMKSYTDSALNNHLFNTQMEQLNLPIYFPEISMDGKFQPFNKNFRQILTIVLERVNEVRFQDKDYYVYLKSETVTNISALLLLRYNYPFIDNFLQTFQADLMQQIIGVSQKYESNNMAFLLGIIFGVLPVSIIIVLRAHKNSFQISRLMNMCKYQNLVFIQQEKNKYELFTQAIKENAVRLFSFQFNIYAKDNEI